jgi:hypothetical protein
MCGTVNEVQKAYLAGLIDGEGSLECQPQMQRTGKTPSFRLAVSFNMVTVEPLRTVGSWFGVEPKRYPAPSENRQPQWRLRFAKTLACQILEECLPYLLLKREQALVMLAIEEVRAANTPPLTTRWNSRTMPAHAVERMAELTVQLRALKREGVSQ